MPRLYLSFSLSFSLSLSDPLARGRVIFDARAGARSVYMVYRVNRCHLTDVIFGFVFNVVSKFFMAFFHAAYPIGFISVEPNVGEVARCGETQK